MRIQPCRIGKPVARGVVLAGLWALLSPLGGCAIPIKVAELNKDIPKAAIPIVVDAGIDKMNDPLTQQRIKDLLSNPQMRAIEKDLVGGLVDSSMAALSDKERAERIGALATRAMAGIVQGAMHELGPALTDTTSGALNGAFDAALSPAHQRAFENLISGIVATTMHAAIKELQNADIGKNLASSITDQLGPALGKAMREQLAPSLAELLKNEELNRALGATARMMAREMVLGATEALAHTQQPREDGSLLSRATELAHQGARLFGSAAWLLLLIIVALVVWTLKLLSQSRQYREEADRRAASARLLSEATKAAEGKAWSDELIGVLKERISAEEEEIAQLRWAKRGRPTKNGQPEPGNGHSGTPHA